MADEEKNGPLSNKEYQEWYKERFKEPEPGKNLDGTDKGDKEDE